MQSGARGMEGCKWAENAALAAKKRGFFQARASRLERLDLLRLSYAALCGPRKMLRPLEGSRAPSRQSKVGGGAAAGRRRRQEHPPAVWPAFWLAGCSCDGVTTDKYRIHVLTSSQLKIKALIHQ